MEHALQFEDLNREFWQWLESNPPADELVRAFEGKMKTPRLQVYHALCLLRYEDDIQNRIRAMRDYRKK